MREQSHISTGVYVTLNKIRRNISFQQQVKCKKHPQKTEMLVHAQVNFLEIYMHVLGKPQIKGLHGESMYRFGLFKTEESYKGNGKKKAKQTLSFITKGTFPSLFSLWIHLPLNRLSPESFFGLDFLYHSYFGIIFSLYA